MRNISAKISALCLLIAVLPGVCHAQTYAITTSYTTTGGAQVRDRATAVCIGNSPGGRSLLLTVKHAVSGANAVVWIANDGDWIRVTRIVRHDTEDLAALECDAELPGVLFADTTPIGDAVTVAGFGPIYAKTSDGYRFRGHIDAPEILRGDDGSHAMPGDSGGPVLYQSDEGPALVGIVSDHEGDRPARSRKTYASRRACTGFVPAETISQFIACQYGSCPNGLCPIRIRQRIQQPVIGIGIPVGPPRIVNEVMPPAPQRQSQACGPMGATGPAGPPGRDGRSVTQQQVEAVVNAWLDNNVDRLRGEPGPPGPAGRDGQSCDPAELTRVQQRLTDIERRPFRMVISSDGHVVDDETYAPGEPVVLDLQRLRKRSDAE